MWQLIKNVFRSSRAEKLEDIPTNSLNTMSEKELYLDGLDLEKKILDKALNKHQLAKVDAMLKNNLAEVAKETQALEQLRHAYHNNRIERQLNTPVRAKGHER